MAVPSYQEAADSLYQEYKNLPAPQLLSVYDEAVILVGKMSMRADEGVAISEEQAGMRVAQYSAALRAVLERLGG